MIAYYMTSELTGSWEACNATTLPSAKREATIRYREGYLDDEIKISIGDDMIEARTTVASKRNTNHSDWLNWY